MPARPSGEGGTPFDVDLSCLTPDQRRLWDEHLPNLRRWTRGSICEVTMLDLWSFGYICMLEAGSQPQWPPELAAELNKYALMLKQYRENVRRAQSGEADD